MSDTLTSLRFQALRIRGLLVTIALFTLVACQQKKTSPLIIATAANMQFAMAELTESFSKKTGIDCETVLGSSGKLTAQIMAGAPYHVFVSADMKYPRQLYEGGLTKATPEVFASGQLVLWSASDTGINSLEVIKDDTVTHIALANPKTAPYGMAAVETLQHLGLYTTLEAKLVYGESISQTNQFITSQAAQIGFTAKSVVLAASQKYRGSWIDIPTGHHSPLAHGVVVLKSDKRGTEAAAAFYEFLFSTEAKEILNKFGYGLP